MINATEDDVEETGEPRGDISRVKLSWHGRQIFLLYIFAKHTHTYIYIYMFIYLYL